MARSPAFPPSSWREGGPVLILLLLPEPSAGLIRIHSFIHSFTHSFVYSSFGEEFFFHFR